MHTNTLRISRSIILIAIFLATSETLWAQEKGHLKGRVSDSEGAAIERTKIIIKSPKAQFETAADGRGEFDIELPIGMYRIETGKMPGFVPFKSSRFRIRADKTTLRNIALKVTLDDAICILWVTAPPIKAKRAAKNNRNQ